MRQHYLLKCYVNKAQYDKIKEDSKKYGSVSNYFRHISLERLSIIEERLESIYFKLQRGEDNEKIRRTRMV